MLSLFYPVTAIDCSHLPQIDVEEYGEHKEVDLKPGGADIAVTEENRDEYIDLVIKHRFVDAIHEQMAR
jgi:desulfoferrodoxin (superoxide reductase-like protein)